MNLVVGRRYRIAFREPGFDVLIVRVGEYLGDEPGLTVESGHAFRLDAHTHAYLLITPSLLIGAEEIDANEKQTQRATARTVALNARPAEVAREHSTSA
jgi:hypothetical protein